MDRSGFEQIYLVGLTGGLGSGKTTAGTLLREACLPVIDTDQVAHDLLADRKGTAYAAVVKRFGKAVLDRWGRVEREKLADAVFKAPSKRKALEKILHPAVEKEVARQLLEAAAAGERIAVLEVPLLVEAGWDRFVDCVVVVDCDEDSQVERHMSRTDESAKQAQARMAAQASRKERLDRADFVLDNNGTLQHLVAQVEGLIDSLNKGWLAKMSGEQEK